MMMMIMMMMMIIIIIIIIMSAKGSVSFLAVCDVSHSVRDRTVPK
jgi:hypothetical protein